MQSLDPWPDHDGPITHGPALRAHLARALDAHPVRQIDDPSARRAAVAIVVAPSDVASDPVDPLQPAAEDMSVVPGDLQGIDGAMVDVAGGASFLLCRRAAKLGRHGGQWALPGGRVDPGEGVLDTARRELHEELGVDLGADAVVGVLDDYATRSGYVITPVVMWADEIELRPDPAEVARVYCVGLHELRRADSPRFVHIPESPRAVVQVPLGRDLIHAPTGALLVQFRWVGLDARVGARVHDFEQPVFAWR